MPSNVVAFPAPKPPTLAPPPEPPRLTLDPRQRRFVGIATGLSNAISGNVQLVNSNVDHGFTASAPDIGKIQTILASSITKMDMREVRKRWAAELSPWFVDVAVSWVQRCREVRLTVRRNGVHVRLQTQDDYGYYSFAFDVFPGVETSKKARRP